MVTPEVETVPENFDPVAAKLCADILHTCGERNMNPISALNGLISAMDSVIAMNDVQEQQRFLVDATKEALETAYKSRYPDA